MARPLKISENNAPLSCKQHDDNIDALLDRRNHTNQIEDCETAINQTSLNDCVENLPYISSLAVSLSDLQSEYEILNSSIIPNGDIDVSIQQLNKKIDDELIPVNSTLLAIATDLGLVESDPITQRTRFLTLNELNARTTSTNNQRELTRKKLDELKSRVENFISQYQDTITKNASDISGLTNPTTGTFTLLSNYVNQSVQPVITKYKNVDEAIVYNNQANIGDVTPLQGESLSRVSSDNKQNIELLTTNLEENKTAINQNVDEIASNKLNLERLKAISTTNNLVVNVNPGPYTRLSGSRGYFNGGTITCVSNKTTNLYLTEEVINSSVIPKLLLSDTTLKEGILLAVVRTGVSKIEEIRDARTNLSIGLGVPYLIKTMGGDGNQGDYVVSGTDTSFLQGEYYFNTFTVPTNTKLLIKGNSTIHVKGPVLIEGTIEITPVTEGGPQIQTSATESYVGNYIGNYMGAGVSTINGTYHWTLFPAGTAGCSSILGGKNDLKVIIASGGRGGGSLKIISGSTIDVSGYINANGEAGRTGVIQEDPTNNTRDGGVSGSGGGAGGSIILQSARTISIQSSARLECNGGVGGNSTGIIKGVINPGGGITYTTYPVNGGGGGGGGWISLSAPGVLIDGSAVLESKGGLEGLNSESSRTRLALGQGGSFGGGFGGKGGNGSAFELGSANGIDNPIEIKNVRPIG